ncbi:MAG: hypothetical protein M1817_000928 [Caeruleum heppii]|nr:MAG: hypothetical protein M1817_000928 [Caeruleum heppii]
MIQLSLIYLGLVFIFTTIIGLSWSVRQRNILLDRIRFRARRDPGASTPPLHLSPEKAPQDVFKDLFPPSRRKYMSASHLDPAKEARPPDPASLTRDPRIPLMPLATKLGECEPHACTATEFSAEDVKDLGDFPDYAKLCGVPLPEAYTEFDINKALPRPYRPLRWPYHQTMSLTRLESDWWLELDKNYALRIKQRNELYQKHGKAVLDYLPGSEIACKELMEMCLQFVCARYPQHFSLSPDKCTFHNSILQTETDLKATHPLHTLLQNIPEDFAIMLRDPESGFYYFRAGVICSSLGWNVGTKIGMQLKEIHAPIPDYKEKMQLSMDRFFSKFPTDKPIQRGSWGLEVDEPLFMPPGDPHEAHRLTQSPTLPLSRIHLRVDWQTLRRLPVSGAIIFNFKALFTPVERFRHEPYVPALCARILKEGKKSLMGYKNTWHVEHVVIPALEAWDREQVERGWKEEGWKVETLAESPWFPGWERKWRADQGF